jgi:hypothetical protein
MSTDLSPDNIGLLKRQLRDVHAVVSNIDHRSRAPRPGAHTSPKSMLSRVLACHLLGRRKSTSAARIVSETYGNDPDVLRALASPGMIGKSAMTPAQTTVSGWAAELSQPDNLDFWQVVSPESVLQPTVATPERDPRHRAPMTPQKARFITVVTDEVSKQSLPSIEAVRRATLSFVIRSVSCTSWQP